MCDLISVIIPVYNSEKYIRNTVESIESQNYSNLELLLVNDGSTDNSLDIMNDLKKKYKNIIIITQKNMGVSAARNNGLKNCKGKYVVFVDSDDILPFDSIQSLYNTIVENNSDVAIGITKVIKNSDNTKFFVDKSDLSKFYYSKEEILKKFLLCDDIYDFHSSCAKMFKFDLIKNLRFEIGRNSNEDRFFLFESLCNTMSVSCINQVVYFYIKHVNSLSTTEPNDRLFDNIYFANEIFSKIKKEYNFLIEEANYNKIITYLMVYRNFARFKKIFFKYDLKMKKLKSDILKISGNKYLSKSKKIELFILSRSAFIYRKLLYLYDLLF